MPDVSRRDAGDVVTSSRSVGETDGVAPPATRRADGDCGAISLLLVVNDATASPPPRASISPRKPHQRKATYFGRTTLVQPPRSPQLGHAQEILSECAKSQGRFSEAVDHYLRSEEDASAYMHVNGVGLKQWRDSGQRSLPEG